MREPLPREFVEALAAASGRLGIFTREILWYPVVSSTNDVAGMLADREAPEGTVVVANAQSAGRGRHGRVWASPPGAGLYVSAIFRPKRDVPLLTIAAGVAIAEGIQSATGLAVDLKWPNDAFVHGRKVAGILAEANSSATGPYVILGCGINIMPAAYPPEVAVRATSLEGELSRAVDRGLLFVECLASVSKWYEDLQRGRLAQVVEAWRLRATATIGRRVRGDVGGTTVDGVVETLDDTGALVVRTRTGLARVTAGELTWV
ncbi:MAG: biotin--[acetyl-CoA-carboxylase] ligase [Acidobacteria bacterium]|nr:biotin--[acetyl-CoA-carboxylase] ligase [Acidobacteriota bacterium]